MKRAMKFVAIMLAFVIAGTGISAAVFYTSYDIYDYAYCSVAYSFDRAVVKETPEGKKFKPEVELTKEKYDALVAKYPSLKTYSYIYMNGNIQCVMGKPEDSINQVTSGTNWETIKNKNNGYATENGALMMTVFLRSEDSVREKQEHTESRLMEAFEYIMSGYVEEFQKNNGTRYTSKIPSTYGKQDDFIEQVEMLNAELDRIREYTETLRDNAENFGFSVQAEAQEVIDKVDVLQNEELKQAEDTIREEGLTRKRYTAIDNYKNEIQRLTYTYRLQKTNEKKYREWIEQYENDKDSMTKTVDRKVINEETDKQYYYEEAVKKYGEIKENIEALEAEIAQKEAWKKNIEDNHTTNEQANKMENALDTIKEEVDETISGPVAALSVAYSKGLLPAEKIQVSEAKYLGTGLFSRQFWLRAIPYIAVSAMIGIMVCVMLVISEKIRAKKKHENEDAANENEEKE